MRNDPLYEDNHLYQDCRLCRHQMTLVEIYYARHIASSCQAIVKKLVNFIGEQLRPNTFNTTQYFSMCLFVTLQPNASQEKAYIGVFSCIVT